jgi:crotonobetainyl-CoA:carnitine CoA-transferase CaiB-like acyl-CoA transferase
MPGALDGIRVLDLSWGIAGPLGVLMLAEQGADVVKVEPPGGDPFRSYSGYKVWTRSRRSVTVDLKSEVGREAFLKLVETADVVVESFRPGVMDRLGVGYAACAAANRRVVYCSVPGYPPGHRLAGRPGYDALVQASSGQQWEQPGWRLGPIFLAMPMPSMGAIFLVPTGVLSALIARETTGRGQHVSTSLLQGAWLYTTQIWQDIEKAPAMVHAMMAKTYPPGVHQQMIFECADREYVHISVLSGIPPLKSLEEVVGVEPLDDAELAGLLPMDAASRRGERLREAFKRRKRDELVAELLANNHATEAIITPEEQFGHPQLIANHMVATVDDPDLGPTTQIGVPVHLLGTPGAIAGPQPRVGEHNDEVWGALGYEAGAVAGAAAGGA